MGNAALTDLSKRKTGRTFVRENKTLYRLWGLHIAEYRTENSVVFSGIRCERQEPNVSEVIMEGLFNAAVTEALHSFRSGFSHINIHSSVEHKSG